MNEPIRFNRASEKPHGVFSNLYRSPLCFEGRFRQDAWLASILLGTGDRIIIECPTVDSEVNRRWGQVNGVGQNWLGVILMEVRAVLSSEVWSAFEAAARRVYLGEVAS